MGIGIGRVLAAILGGAGEGALKGYTYEQEEKDRKLRQDQLEEDRQARRGETEHRLALEEHDRDVQESERARRESERQAAADFVASLPQGPIRQAAEAAYNGIHGLQPGDFEAPGPTQDDLHRTTEQELPEWLRPSFHASGHKAPAGGYKPDDLLSPDARVKKEEGDAARKRKDTLATYQGEREIDQRMRSTPVTPVDDPTLPAGAKTYIASLPTKYRGDYDAAFTEFQSALPSLLQDHPRMDVRKARQAFDDAFPDNARPARPRAGNTMLDDLFNSPDAAATAGATSEPVTRSRTPVTPATSTPPVQPQDAGAAQDRDLHRRARFEQLKTQIEDRKRRGLDYDDLVREMLKLRQATR